VSVTGEVLTLTGSGINSGGALRNVSGTDTWTGKVTLAGDSSIGADGASQLTISGAINEGAAGSGLTKEGTGTLVLTHANTYSGITTVHQGILNIQDPLALGGSAAAGVVVIGRATLQTQVSVSGELLTLNGPGVNNTGALDNVTGINTWSGNVTLATDGSVVLTDNATIGVDAGASQLTMSGDITERVPGGFGITKAGPNRLVLSGFNRYTGAVEVQQGILSIQNDNALGTTDAGTMVDNGAVLEIQGGIHVGKEALTVNGSGINNTGALLNVADDNLFDGNVIFGRNVVIGVSLNSRLTMRGNFSDGQNGFSLTKAG